MDPLRRDFIAGKSPRQLIDLTRTVFKRLIKDKRLAAFEPVEGDDVFFGYLFDSELDHFHCSLRFTGAKYASLCIVLTLGGETVGQYEVTNFGGVEEVVEILESRVESYMEERFERVKDTLRLRQLEVSTTMRESMEALFFVHVKTYRYGVTSWPALMRLRGPPTVHVIANDADGMVPDDGSAVLVFTWPHGEPIWGRSRSRAETTRFLVEIEKLFV